MTEKRNAGKEKRSFREIVKAITTCKSVGQLVFKCIMMVVVPYIYLYVCGILDSVLLRGGFAYREEYILFVFFSLMLFWAIGFTLAGMSIFKWIKRDKEK